jgi:hypothetical protein
MLPDALTPGSIVYCMAPRFMAQLALYRVDGHWGGAEMCHTDQPPGAHPPLLQGMPQGSQVGAINPDVTGYGGLRDVGRRDQ